MAEDAGAAPSGASKGSSPDMEEYEVIPDSNSIPQPKEAITLAPMEEGRTHPDSTAQELTS